MRLLMCNAAGEFSLTKQFIGNDDIPPYAILSHTWGENEDEVTFQDLKMGTGKSKAGYRKIDFCREQAIKDGLQYIWIDTCAIDQSNNAELAEALNSMFRWYRNSTKCYVYLSDVSMDIHNSNDVLSRSRLERDFRLSRWFTRGWTLQELIAPHTVEFFSAEGKALGDKKSMEQQIHNITGIPVRALRGNMLSQYTIEERMTWAAKRDTKREEDIAYCLMGLFEVHMLPIYGEGRHNAIIRLREEIGKRLNDDDPQSTSRLLYSDEDGFSTSRRHKRLRLPTIDQGLTKQLERLPHAVNAPFNAYINQHNPTCFPDTRVDLLEEIYTWADGQDERFIFWLNGLAGTGKSTIARTVARKYFEAGRLGASFFFSKQDSDLSHAGKFFTTIAIQLSKKSPLLQRHICDAIRENGDIATQSLTDQWRQLVLKPLSQLSANSHPPSYILIVDALDECDNNKDIRVLLQLLAEARSLESIQFRIFLTSRPESSIRNGFYQIPATHYQEFGLHNMSPSILDRDIFKYLEHNLRLLGHTYSIGPNWPTEEAIRHLVQRASGLFIWVATAYRFIEEGEKRRVIKNRLSTLLDSDSADAEISEPEGRLNQIYTTVLSYSLPDKCSDKERKELLSSLQSILGSIVVLLSPLSIHSLGKLICMQREDIEDSLDNLHAIVDIPKDQNRPLRLNHPSFRDFLLNKDRCSDSNFWVDEKQAHQTLAVNCIQLMSKCLKRDICELNDPSIIITGISKSLVDKYLSADIQYACLYWIQHLEKGGTILCDNDQVHQFLSKSLLHWLEALGWMQKISEGIHAIRALEAMTAVSYIFLPTSKRPFS
jgi:Heterokaryon incompatibility protein (HET)/NACHT domain